MRSFKFIILLLIVLGIIADYSGYVWHNSPFSQLYGAKGLDVSNHQEGIDWDMVSKSSKFEFVYIKATEGHDFYDDFFTKNWKGAKHAGFRVGAYHFFSLRSSGEDQAKYFIKHVPVEKNSLPPVIDVEVPLVKDISKVREEIKIMADILEFHYGKKPIIYVTKSSYRYYIKGHFSEYDLWVRDIYKPPLLFDRKWVIWQYSNRGRVNGVSGFVDINVLRVPLEDL